MATPYVAQISFAGFNFAPMGWAFCNGQLLPISQFEVVYALIGTTYGGDGVTTFALPNMQGRAPINQGTGQGLSTYVLGQSAGAESVTLTQNNLPSHTHLVNASTGPATTQTATNAFLATGVDGEATNPIQIPKIYLPTAAGNTSVNMAAQSISSAGLGQPTSVLQPILTVNCIIALEGIFPSQN